MKTAAQISLLQHCRELRRVGAEQRLAKANLAVRNELQNLADSERHLSMQRADAIVRSAQWQESFFAAGLPAAVLTMNDRALQSHLADCQEQVSQANERHENARVQAHRAEQQIAIVGRQLEKSEHLRKVLRRESNIRQVVNEDAQFEDIAPATGLIR